MILRIVLYTLAALLIGAHFLRAGNIAVVLICIALPGAFLYRRRVSLLLLQAGAYGAAAIWLHAAWQLVQMRQSLGQPWTLALAILGGVAIFSMVTGVLLNARIMREHYPR